MNAFTIRDIKADNYGYPFPAITRATAMREIQMRMETTPILKNHAEDFSLHYCGEWNDIEGVFESAERQFVCELHELIELPEFDSAQIHSA